MQDSSSDDSLQKLLNNANQNFKMTTTAGLNLTYIGSYGKINKSLLFFEKLI